jgi:hypothetical protein
MSYMNQAAFAPAGGLQELSIGEIEEVGGGVPMVLGVAIALYGPAAVKATVAGAAFAVGFAATYYASHED